MQVCTTADTLLHLCTGEHQMELLDCVAAKFHEEPGVFKLLVGGADVNTDRQTDRQTEKIYNSLLFFCCLSRLWTLSWHYSGWTSVGAVSLPTGSRN